MINGIQGSTGSLLAGIGVSAAVLLLALVSAGNTLTVCRTKLAEIRNSMDQNSTLLLEYTDIVRILEDAAGPFWNYGCTVSVTGNSLRVVSFSGEPVLSICPEEEPEKGALVIHVPGSQHRRSLSVSAWKLISEDSGKNTLIITMPGAKGREPVEVYFTIDGTVSVL
ncbi:MAG: hypothetical protein ACLFSE_08400 [Spirochaetia bacterium]